MSAVSKQDLMDYCRVDDASTGELLVSLADSAEEYLTACGIYRSGENAGRYDLAVKAMTLNQFDAPTGGAYPPGLRQLINQLKLS